MKKIVLLLSLTWFCGYAQQEDFINADRPDQSEGVYVLPKSKFQLEDGFLFSNGIIGNSLMFRYGAFKNLEFRLESDFQLKDRRNFEFNDLVLSTKYSITKGSGWIPAITVVGYLTYNIMPESYFSPDVTLAFEYSLSDNLAFDWNVGINDQFSNWVFTAELNYNPIDKLGVFLEYYGNFADRILPNHSVDAGLMYAINPNFQIDLATGRTLFGEANYFVVMGFAYRFKH